MTEFWVSQKNAWCEYCKVWLKDSVQSWAVHERGIKHKENVARKLREMRQKADQEKRDEERAVATMGAIEAEARRQYAADVAEAEQARQARQAALGEWVWSKDAGYYYNAAQRWYYDPGTAMYYGGDPVAWTKDPAGMPHEARYEVQLEAKEKAVLAAAAAKQGPPPLPSGGAAASRGVTAGMRTAPKHPMAEIGGHQLHKIEGSVGGAKGVGAQGAGSAAAATKRKREEAQQQQQKGGKGKEVSKEEQEALARREAARARVQARTAAGFGLI